MPNKHSSGIDAIACVSGGENERQFLWNVGFSLWIAALSAAFSRMLNGRPSPK